MISDEEKKSVILGMETYGGEFTKGLAQALKSADEFNVQKIKDNIIEMIKYKQLGIIKDIFPIMENDYSHFERRNLTKNLVDVLNQFI